MATKIRLQRFGKKGKPVYHIVAADSRSKRDGRHIEKLGLYNPNTAPATIDLNHDRALYWVQVGAVPTDTARAILSYTGVMMKKHLLDGVKKNAHTEEQALAKYESWLEAKVQQIGNESSAIAKTKADAAAKAGALLHSGPSSAEVETWEAQGKAWKSFLQCVPCVSRHIVACRAMPSAACRAFVVHCLSCTCRAGVTRMCTTSARQAVHDRQNPLMSFRVSRMERINK